MGGVRETGCNVKVSNSRAFVHLQSQCAPLLCVCESLQLQRAIVHLYYAYCLAVNQRVCGTSSDVPGQNRTAPQESGIPLTSSFIVLNHRGLRPLNFMPAGSG